MSEWITDRRPTKDDATDYEGMVFGWYEYPSLKLNQIEITKFDELPDGVPWAVIQMPKPYLKPQRFRVTHSLEGDPIVMECETNTIWATAPTREAAERIAAIYKEVMP